MIQYKRILLSLFFVVFLLLILNAKNDTPPNFIIILGDDIAANSIGCYGSKTPYTSPNIDALAKEGVLFRNMFVSEAMCAPTRAELYTGLTPYSNGCVINHGATKVGTLSMVQRLSTLGYRVGLTGKTHIKPLSVYPFEKIKGFPSGCTVSGDQRVSWSGVKEFMTRDDKQPFCLVIASVNAHSPWDAGDTSPWKLSDLVLPPSLIDNDTTRKFFREYIAEVRLFDDQVGQVNSLLKKLKKDNNTALIVLDENGIGMPGGKWTTYDLGVRSACIMKWPPSIVKNPFETDAIAQYCDILPTLIDAAGGTVPSDMDGKSLLPVLTEKSKKHRENAYFIHNSGKESSAFASRAITDGQYKLIWTLTPENKYTVRTINGFDYGYIDKKPQRHVRRVYTSWLADSSSNEHIREIVNRFRIRPELQFFDLNKDPYELNNLAKESKYQEKIETMKANLISWMDDKKDDRGQNYMYNDAILTAPKIKKQKKKK